jgi:hypothetical protein
MIPLLIAIILLQSVTITLLWKTLRMAQKSRDDWRIAANRAACAMKSRDEKMRRAEHMLAVLLPKRKP